MSVRENVTAALDTLSDAELQEVAEFVAFLRFRSRLGGVPKLKAAAVAALYAEGGEEDRILAEAGMDTYAENLHEEDQR